MGNSSSTSNKKPGPKYPECECLNDAVNNQCKNRKCLSLDGHYCICDRGYDFEHNYTYCQAKKHVCICEIYGPNICKSNTKEHPCTCRNNWRIKTRKNHIGHCKASEGHPCFCKHDKTKCQACY